jgi:hypothetical protein
MNGTTIEPVLLTLDDYLILRRTWRELGVDHYLVSASLEPNELSERILAVAYLLLKQGQYESVLVLVASSEDVGLINDWLLDCRARALMFSKRYSDARCIWEGMIGIGDERMKLNVTTMLSVCCSRERDAEQEFLRRRLKISANSLDELLALWTQFPTSSLVEEAIHEVVQQRLSLENPNWMLLDSSLRAESTALEAQIIWLMFVESKLKTASSLADWLDDDLSVGDDDVVQEVLSE